MRALILLVVMGCSSAHAEPISLWQASLMMSGPSGAHFIAQEYALEKNPRLREINLLGGIDRPGRAAISVTAWVLSSVAIHEASKRSRKAGWVVFASLAVLQIAGTIVDVRQR